jgi:hypothetical protein
MLFQATLLIDLTAMAITLWMAFYLFARGFSSTITLRMVLISLLLAAFFFDAYNNIFVQVPGTAAIRALFVVIALSAWYSLTYRVMSESDQQRFRWIEWGIYGLGIASIYLLLQPGAFIGEEGNALYVAHMDNRPAYRVYSLYQFLVSFGILGNLLVSDRVGLTSRGKYYLTASIFPVLSVVYGVISLGRATASPRIVQDTLVFLGIFILNVAVARHQIWTERRATLQDFPLTTFAALGLAALYGYVAWARGMGVQFLASVVGLAIITLGIYDFVREFLERQRIYNESQFRKQLNRLEAETMREDALKAPLQNGLDLLCETLKAPGGFIAIHRGEEFVVMAGRSSIPAGSGLPAAVVTCDDISHPKAESLSSIAWIAPAFDGQMQVAVIGISRHGSKLDYSTGDLDVLAEVAEHVGKIVSLGGRLSSQAPQAVQQIGTTDINTAADEMIASLSTSPSTEFVRHVEDALRHFSDYTVLGESPLVEWAGIRAESHVECGKQLQKYLAQAIDSFRPAGTRPPEPLPRVWYSYAVLYDAYVEGVPNREIMARLYISEGTFNRTRRTALRGLARSLQERAGPGAQLS